MRNGRLISALLGVLFLGGAVLIPGCITNNFTPKFAKDPKVVVKDSPSAWVSSDQTEATDAKADISPETESHIDADVSVVPGE